MTGQEPGLGQSRGKRERDPGIQNRALIPNRT